MGVFPVSLSETAVASSAFLECPIPLWNDLETALGAAEANRGALPPRARFRITFTDNGTEGLKKTRLFRDMLIHRRSFLQGAGVLSTSFAVPTTRNFAVQDPPSSPWRTFEVTIRVEVLQPAGVTRLWIPAALRRDTPFQRTLATTFRGPGGSVRTFQNKTEALELIAAEFPA